MKLTSPIVISATLLATLQIHNASAFLTAGTRHVSTRCRSSWFPNQIFALTSSRRKSTYLNGSPGNVHRPENEFSRTYRPERILGGGPRQRDYAISIDAEKDELKELAQRFDLSNIDKLEADLNLRREGQERGSRVLGVEVEGVVRASVTQTCVRTGEAFDVDLEFDIFAIVRPIASASMDDNFDGIDVAGLEEAALKSNRRGNKGKQNVKSVRTAGNLNEMDVMELQRMLQDFDVEDDVIEDESIYSTNGMLDVGELVSQLFWLKLDPYPKKPGTGPIFTTISG